VAIRVELFGIVRQHAGVAETRALGQTLGDVLTDLSRQFPALSEQCIEGNRLRPGYLANLDGDRFITEPATEIPEGSAILILSADAGG